MNSKVYRSCAVPQCTNTSIKTPSKLFVNVPLDQTIRNKWFNLARRDPAVLSPSSVLYFCEDHFDLPNDMDNYIRYVVMGAISRVRMKPGCIPTRFHCQPDRKKGASGTIQRKESCSRSVYAPPVNMEDASSHRNAGDKSYHVTQQHFTETLDPACVKLETQREDFTGACSRSLSDLGRVQRWISEESTDYFKQEAKDDAYSVLEVGRNMKTEQCNANETGNIEKWETVVPDSSMAFSEPVCSQQIYTVKQEVNWAVCTQIESNLICDTKAEVCKIDIEDHDLPKWELTPDQQLGSVPTEKTIQIKQERG